MTRRKTISLIAATLVIGATLGGAAASRAQTAGAFLQRGFGPRGISMGNAQVADVFGNGSPWYNPALAPFYADQSVEASYTFLSHDRALEYIQFLVPMQPKGTVLCFRPDPFFRWLAYWPKNGTVPECAVKALLRWRHRVVQANGSAMASGVQPAGATRGLHRDGVPPGISACQGSPSTGAG